MQKLKHLIRQIIKSYFCLCMHLFYRKIEVRGLKNIPKNKPVIFAGNHQLAILDALLIVCSSKKQPSTLTSAFIFNSLILAKILSVLKLIPIYRIRDGVKSLQKNEEIFKRCNKLLSNNEAVTIFPEADQHADRRLRPLTKGISRLAFKAEESEDFKLNSVIVPVGINFSNQYNFNSKLFINYGVPIEVKKYVQLYREHPQKGMLKLKEKVAKSIRLLMIDIKSNEYYKTIELIREIFRENYADFLNINLKELGDEFDVDKKLIQVLELIDEVDHETLDELEKLVTGYDNGLQKHNLRDWLIKKKEFSFPKTLLELSLGIVGLPLFLFGFLNNIIPYLFHMIFTRVIVDKQFLPGVRISISIFFFPIYYLLILVLFSLLSVKVTFSLIYIIALPITGYYALKYFIRIKKVLAKIRFVKLIRKKDDSTLNLISLREKIIEIMDNVITKHDIADKEQEEA